METDLVNIRAILATTPARWQALGTVPNDLLVRRPLPDQWSALDCLRHLVTTETTLYPVRVRQFLADQPFDPFDADMAAAQSDDEPVGVLIAQFTQRREESLTLFDSLKPEDLARVNEHPALGHVTLRQMLHTWATHDLNHMVQAERSLMQPFIAGCGPWRSFFKDHIMVENSASE
jgi:hypothetical protein